MKVPLYERIKKLEEKYSPEKLRKGLRLFARITKLNEEELKNLIEDYRTTKQLFLPNDVYKKTTLGRELKDYEGLAQSVLYTKVKQRTGDWKKAYEAIGGKFDLPNGGSYITADQEGELRGAEFSGAGAGSRVEFSGKYAGSKAKFSGVAAGEEAVFSGKYAGAEAEFSNIMSGIKAEFSGEYAGISAKFSGFLSGTSANFSGKYAGSKAEFTGASSGLSAKFSGPYSGAEAKFIGKEAGNKAKFTGYEAGKDALFNLGNQYYKRKGMLKEL